MPINLYLILGCSMGVILLLIVIVVPIVVCRKHQKPSESTPNHNIPESDDIQLPSIPVGGYNEFFFW
jgi:hypothetical protein